MATKRKRSIFCEKQPNGYVMDAIVFVGDVWVLCKGRRYYDGSLKYLHNGKEGKVTRRKWINISGMDKVDIEEEVCRMNVANIRATKPTLHIEPTAVDLERILVTLRNHTARLETIRNRV